MDVRPDRAPVPVRVARHGPAPHDARLRARVPDQVALLRPVDQREHARARDRPPVVRRQRRPADVGGDLVQRGLGHVVGLVLEQQAERQRDDRRAAVHEQLQLDAAADALERRAVGAGERGEPVRHVPGLHAPGDDARRRTARSSATRRSSASSAPCSTSTATRTSTSASSSPWPRRSRSSRPASTPSEHQQARRPSSPSG